MSLAAADWTARGLGLAVLVVNVPLLVINFRRWRDGL